MESYQIEALKQFNIYIQWLFPIYLVILLQLQIIWYKALVTVFIRNFKWEKVE